MPAAWGTAALSMLRRDWRSRVLLPTPASPPGRTTQAATRPPPRSRFSSPSPALVRVCTPGHLALPNARGRAPTWPLWPFGGRWRPGRAEPIDAVPAAAARAPPPWRRETRTRALPAHEGPLVLRPGTSLYVASPTTRTSGAPAMTSVMTRWSSSRPSSTVLPRGKRPESTSSASRSST